MIPEEIIDEIQTKTDIVELISSYIPLKRAGKNFRALCPFHSEKTPSFFVNPQRQIFHCFGCGVGGGVIQFIMEYEKVSFPEAVEMLAKRLGISLPQKRLRDSGNRDYLYKVNQLAADYFFENIFSSSGSRALSYLMRRGIKENIIKEFKIGYALRDYRDLFNYLRNKGVSISILDKLSLVVKGKDGSYFDLFRDRIIFPISDVRGRIIGFGGRIITDNTSQPKYINTPASPLYTKGKNLFGLSLSKEYVLREDFCLVVEGYLDMITPFAAGIKNIVASLGTALTQEQIRLIKRYTKDIILVFDSDKAGQNASLRAIDMMLEEDMVVKVLELPAGYDPDRLVRERKEDFLKLLGEAKDFFVYKLDILRKAYDGSIAARAKIASEMIQSILKLQNEVQRQEYIKLLGSSLGVAEEALRIEMRKQQKGKAGQRYVEMNLSQDKSPFEEEHIIKSMIFYPEIIPLVEDALKDIEWEDRVLGELFAKVIECYHQEKKFSEQQFLEHCSAPQLVARFSKLVFNDFKLDEKVLEEVILKIRRRHNQRLRDYVRQNIKEAEQKGDEERIRELMQEYKALLKER